MQRKTRFFNQCTGSDAQISATQNKIKCAFIMQKTVRELVGALSGSIHECPSKC